MDSVVNTTLCDPCQCLISLTKEDSEGVLHDHHRHNIALLQSAESGCPLCSTICHKFLNFLDDDKNLPRHPKRHTKLVALKYHLAKADSEVPVKARWMFQFYSMATTSNRQRHENHVGNLEVYPAKGFASQRVGNYTGSPQSWKLALYWIQQCVKSHPRCNRKTQPNWLPTRLLDVGTLNNPELRLRHSSDVSVASSYMTLSHCWGKIEIMKLKEATLHSMCENIAMDELPKTFQEAINFTRASGVRFLWIDSLCIIQDSRTDWVAESTAMSKVYKHSFLNIAATVATDGRSGCFFSRNPVLVHPCRVNMPRFPAKTSKTGVYDIIDQSFWYSNVSNAPLNQRAWVLQEQILSPRVLHCSQTQLLWECYETAACESYPKGVPRDIMLETLVFDFKWSGLAEELRVKSMNLAQKNLNTTLTPKSIEDALHLWDALLFNYCKRALTNFEDKLVAVSALAKEIQPLIGEEYLAGMWRAGLPLNLLWWVSEDQNKKLTKSTTYSAPSWSWASISAPVVFKRFVNPSDHHSFMIEIPKFQINIAAQDMMGQVTGGHLQVRGWMKSLKGLELHDKTRWGSVWVNEMTSIAQIMMDYDEKYLGEELFLLPIAEVKPSFDKEIVIGGLLLVSSGQENQYRRAGMFTSEKSQRALLRRPLYPTKFTRTPMPEAFRRQEDATLPTTESLPVGKSMPEVQSEFQGPNQEIQDIVQSSNTKKWGMKLKEVLPWKKTINNRFLGPYGEEIDTDEWVERLITII